MPAAAAVGFRQPVAALPSPQRVGSQTCLLDDDLEVECRRGIQSVHFVLPVFHLLITYHSTL